MNSFFAAIKTASINGACPELGDHWRLDHVHSKAFFRQQEFNTDLSDFLRMKRDTQNQAVHQSVELDEHLIAISAKA